jgi:hypothetical protein
VEENIRNAWELAETVPASDGSGTRCQALVLTIILGVFSVLVLALVARGLPVYADDEPGDREREAPAAIAESTSGNLLPNGNMDQLGFYWRYPNHWIAGGWFEWFSVVLRIPELNDGYERGFYHSYPSSQRLQLWGAGYAGGLMQSVTVAPCSYYRFQAYGQSRPGSDDPPPVNVASHMKVGIEPYGWMSGRSIADYDPALEPSEFPATVVWSSEATHDFSFAPYAVTAEARANIITVILFSNPEVDPDGGVLWNDTIWDTASLVQAQPPSGLLVSPGTLRPPDGEISGVTSTPVFNAATLQWQTSAPAFSQVLYHYVAPASPGTSLPPIVTSTEQFEHRTNVVLTALKSHSIKLRDLSPASVYDVALLSRRWTGSRCQTSVYVTRIETSDMIVPEGILPAPSGVITALHAIPRQQSAYLWWRTTVPAYSQVLYHRVQPGPTPDPPEGYQIYLPLVMGNSPPPTSYFEFKSTPSSAPDTVHWHYLPDLEPETAYDFVAVGAWTEGDVDKFAASAMGQFTTGVYAQIVGVTWEDMPSELRALLCSEPGLCPGDE